MAFRVGQKVVCVDATDSMGELAKGAVYKIESISGTYLRLVGVSIKWKPYNGWRITRFRPLVTKSTDTGFAILEEIRKRESVPDRIPVTICGDD